MNTAFIGFLICSLFGCSKSPEFDLDAYKTQVSACRADIYDNTIYIANMGKWEINYWKALGDTSDDMADRAYSWLAENSDATQDIIESSHESIKDQYKNIVLLEIEGKAAEEIDSAFRSMYEAYDSMYSLVLSPSGSLSSFSEDISDNLETINKSNETLLLFLDTADAEQ